MPNEPKILATCTQGHTLRLPQKYAGRRVQCPRCQEVFRAAETVAVAVPVTEAAEAATAPPVGVSSVSAPPVSVPPLSVPPVRVPAVAAPAVVPQIVERQEGVQGYRPERSWVRTTYALAAGLILLVLFQLVPTYGRFNPATAPSWVRALLLMALLQAAFAVWLVSLPDWCTVRVTMFVLAGVAMLYGVVLGRTMFTPRTASLAWDLNDVREKVSLWCASVLLLQGLMIYALGRVGFRWRKAANSMLRRG